MSSDDDLNHETSNTEGSSNKVSLDDLLDRLEDLEAENDELHEANTKLKAINEGLQQKLKAFLATKADLEDEVDDLTQLLQEMKQKLAEETKETIALDARNADLEDENEQLKKKEKSDRTAFETAAREHAAEIIQLKDQFFQVQSNLELEKKELSETIRKLNEEAEDSLKKTTRLTSYKADLDEEIRLAHERNEKLVKKMRGFEQIVDAERREFRATTHKLQGEVDTLRQHIEIEKTSLASKLKLNAEQVAEIDKLNAQLAAINQEKSTLEREKRGLARENDRNKQTITENERERADLKKQLNKQEDEVQRLRKLLYG